MYVPPQAMEDIAIGLAPVVLDTSSLKTLRDSIPPTAPLPGNGLLERASLLKILTDTRFPRVLDGRVLSPQDLSEGQRWQTDVHYQLYKIVMTKLNQTPLDKGKWMYGSHFINDPVEKRQPPQARWTALVRSGETIGSYVQRPLIQNDRWRLVGISPTCMVTLAQDGQTRYTTPGSLLVCRAEMLHMKN